MDLVPYADTVEI